MKIEEVNQSIIGHRVSCIENGYRVTGTIKGIREDEYCVYVKIEFDRPLTCWSGDFNTESWVETEYESWGRKLDGFGNLQYTTIIDTLDWLKDYKPKHVCYTDKFEMQEIADNLGLEYMSNEKLQEVRNNVVMFYSKLIDDSQVNGSTSENHDYNVGLMSVTTVIEHYMRNRGMEV
jgi:hypothetical protein